MIESALLARTPGLAHGLSTRAHGSIGPLDDSVAAARRVALAASTCGDGARLVAPHQVHGRRVVCIDTAEEIGRADGVATTRSDVTLMVQGADCPLVGLVDADARVLVLLHSGWRGTAQRIAEVGVRVARQLGARPERIRAAVFPGACGACLEVGPEVVDEFARVFGTRSASWQTPSGRPGHASLDLAAAITATLVDAGVGVENVERVPGCTMCGERLFSHRASGGGPGRSGLFARLLPGS